MSIFTILSLGLITTNFFSSGIADLFYLILLENLIFCSDSIPVPDSIPEARDTLLDSWGWTHSNGLKGHTFVFDKNRIFIYIDKNWVQLPSFFDANGSIKLYENYAKEVFNVSDFSKLTYEQSITILKNYNKYCIGDGNFIKYNFIRHLEGWENWFMLVLQWHWHRRHLNQHR